MHGLTECMRTTYLPPDEIDRRPSSVGRGMPHVKLWIEDPQGNKLGEGETGEMYVSGPNIMKGYWNDPESTAKVIRMSPEGNKELRTGDLFTMDPVQAARACRYLGVRKVIPIHWGTFPALTGTPEKLERALEIHGTTCEVVTLKPGESY